MPPLLVSTGSKGDPKVPSPLETYSAWQSQLPGKFRLGYFRMEKPLIPMSRAWVFSYILALS